MPAVPQEAAQPNLANFLNRLLEKLSELGFHGSCNFAGKVIVVDVCGLPVEFEEAPIRVAKQLVGGKRWHILLAQHLEFDRLKRTTDL